MSDELPKEMVEEVAQVIQNGSQGVGVLWEEETEASRESYRGDAIRALGVPTVHLLIAERRLLLADRDAVYALHPGPADQVAHIPLPDFVRTRFVTVEEHNDLADRCKEEVKFALTVSGLAEAERDDLKVRCDGLATGFDHANEIIAEVEAERDRLRRLLLRAEEGLWMLKPPQSEFYTNGLEADITAELDRQGVSRAALAPAEPRNET